MNIEDKIWLEAWLDKEERRIHHTWWSIWAVFTGVLLGWALGLYVGIRTDAWVAPYVIFFCMVASAYLAGEIGHRIAYSRKLRKAKQKLL